MIRISMGCAWPNRCNDRRVAFVRVQILSKVTVTMRRKAIKMQPHEDHMLRQMHRASRIPVDQWAQRPRFLSRFTNDWNDSMGRHDTGDDIRHYILTQRKQ